MVPTEHPASTEPTSKHPEVMVCAFDRQSRVTALNTPDPQFTPIPEHELQGTQLNNLRNLSNPLGLHVLMLQDLATGMPSAGYALTPDAGGTERWVFSALAPHREGTIAVGVNPQNKAMLALAEDLYPRVLQRELETSSMPGGPGAAVIGARTLTSGLASYGFPTYQDFVSAILTAEVRGRNDLRPDPDRNPGHRFGRSMRMLHDAFLVLEEYCTQVVSLRHACDALGRAAQETALRAKVVEIGCLSAMEALEPEPNNRYDPREIFNQLALDCEKLQRHTTNLEELTVSARPRLLTLQACASLTQLLSIGLGQISRERHSGIAGESSTLLVTYLSDALAANCDRLQTSCEAVKPIIQSWRVEVGQITTIAGSLGRTLAKGRSGRGMFNATPAQTDQLLTRCTQLVDAAVLLNESSNTLPPLPPAPLRQIRKATKYSVERAQNVLVKSAR